MAKDVKAPTLRSVAAQTSVEYVTDRLMERFAPMPVAGQVAGSAGLGLGGFLDAATLRKIFATIARVVLEILANQAEAPASSPEPPSPPST